MCPFIGPQVIGFAARFFACLFLIRVQNILKHPEKWLDKQKNTM